MTRPRVLPSPAVRAERAYRVPRHPAPVDLLLHGNEGPRPPAALLHALAREDPELLRRYPSAAPVEAALAERFGLAPERVLVTAGGDDALDRAFRAFLWPGREVLLPVPTFVMLARYARLVGATTVTVPWPEGPYPVDAVLARVTPDTGAIVVVSPNNPTGAVIDAAGLRALAAGAPGAALLVDLAYTEFADEDLTSVALELDNAIAFRTLSKAWGLAGARVGYTMGPAELIGHLRAAGNPYSVSAPSVALALAHLASGDADVAAYVAAVRHERAILTALLTELGCAVPPSQGNFVLARLRPARALWLRDALAGLGIAVRAFPEHPELAGAVRITCPADPVDLARLTRAIEAALGPVGLIVEDVDALGGLGEAPGWFFSGAAEDLLIARDKGVVPIGLARPDADPPEALYAAGAARIVSDPADLEEVLP